MNDAQPTERDKEIYDKVSHAYRIVYRSSPMLGSPAIARIYDREGGDIAKTVLAIKIQQDAGDLNSVQYALNRAAAIESIVKHVEVEARRIFDLSTTTDKTLEHVRSRMTDLIRSAYEDAAQEGKPFP